MASTLKTSKPSTAISKSTSPKALGVKDKRPQIKIVMSRTDSKTIKPQNDRLLLQNHGRVENLDIKPYEKTYKNSISKKTCSPSATGRTFNHQKIPLNPDSPLFLTSRTTNFKPKHIDKNPSISSSREKNGIEEAKKNLNKLLTVNLIKKIEETHFCIEKTREDQTEMYTEVTEISDAIRILDQTEPVHKSKTFFPKVKDYDGEGDLISKRTDISMLNLDIGVIQELKCTYAHCIGISENQNHILAFAVGISESFKLNSNLSYKIAVISSFENMYTISNVRLKRRYKLKFLDLRKFVKELEKILKEIYANYKDIGLDRNYEGFEDFKDLSELSKAFGVTSVIIKNENKNHNVFYKEKLNGKAEYNKVELNFLAMKVNDLYNMTVLITNSHQFEDNYDLAKGVSKQIQNCIRIKDFDMKNDMEIKLKEEILVEMSLIFASISKDTIGKLMQNDQCFIDHAEIMKSIRLLKLKINLIQDKKDLKSIIPPKLFNIYDILNDHLLCESCKKPNPDFFNTFSCYFHLTCLESLFLSWFNLHQVAKNDTTFLSLPCPSCPNKVLISSFIQTSLGQKYSIQYKTFFENKSFCAICSSEVFNQNYFKHSSECSSKICKTCIATSSLSSGLECKCGKVIKIDMQTEKAICNKCGIETMLLNFISVFDKKVGLVCKKCWMVMLRDRIDGYGKEDMRKVRLELLKEYVKCEVCGNSNYKKLNDLWCLNGCRVCFDCFDQEGCRKCAGSLVYMAKVW